MAKATKFSARRQGVRWTVLSAIGLASGMFAGVVLGAPVQAVVGMMLVTPALTCMAGAILGSAQWLELRRHFAPTGWWVLASTVGLGLGLTVAVVLVEQVGRALTGRQVNVATLGVWERAVSLAVVGLVSGAALGASQWLVLRRVAFGACRWLWVCPLAFGIALAAAALVVETLPAGLPAPARLGAFIVVAGLLAGALTATQLVRLNPGKPEAA
jgi:hypothetical protein